MNRREFIALVGGVVWTVPARAQELNRVARIGFLAAGGAADPRTQRNVATFADALRNLGWISSRNIEIEYRWGAGGLDKVQAFAKELVGLQLDVIVAATTRVAAALQRETRVIPILFVNVSDPIGSGFVASLSRPGGNMTGFIDSEASLGGKWIELLKACAPRVARVSLMFNPRTAPAVEYYMPSVTAAAHALDVELLPGEVHSAQEIEGLIRQIAQSNDGAIVVMPDSFPGTNQDLIVSLARSYRVPIIYPWRYMAAAGGLISYGVDPADAFGKAPMYVDRILKGENAGDLPVQQPTKFELVINLKAARALGLTIPASLITRADEVIE
jgi:putative tryptophan/tyrosine transport system substrate-binding protein